MSRRTLLLVLAILVSNAAAFAQSCPPGNSWCSGTYAYDAMGNIRAIGADTYVYDTAGRLVSGTADVQRTGIMSRQDYAYDAFGNRLSASRTTGSVDCLGGCELSPPIDTPTNHITVSSGAQYDDAGNLKFIPGTPSATYTYDAAGNLVHAVAGTDDRQFIYTAGDERLATANGVSWTWTVRGFDGKVLREFTSLQAQSGLPTSSWQWSKDYVWRDGLLLASVAPTTPGASTTTTQHFHLDHLGTPRLVTGDNGVQLSVHAYYPFGAELNLTASEQPAELMKFTGHERDLLASDPHTLDYMHARFYNPNAGRFLSVDPSLDQERATHLPQGWNRYSYVENNPVAHTDPTGKFLGVDDLIEVAAVVYIVMSNPETVQEIQETGASLAGLWMTLSEQAQKAPEAFHTDQPTKEDVHPDVKAPYKRPSNATTPEQRKSVQNQPCGDCGKGGKMNADHKDPIVKQYYKDGKLDMVKVKDVNAVRPQCPTCSAKQGGLLSQWSKAIKELLGFE
jgi:RHS repeat-associated protein